MYTFKTRDTFHIASIALAPTFRFHRLNQNSQHPKNVKRNPINKVNKDEHRRYASSKTSR